MEKQGHNNTPYEKAPKAVENGHVSTMTVLDDEKTYITDQEFVYGWFGFTPKYLQKLNKGVWILVFLTAANTIVSGTYNGLAGSVQSSIETRFQLTSTQSSWTMISFDLASIAAGLVFTYIGSNPHLHKARLIAMNLVVCSGACVLYALPHFTTPVYEPEGSVDTEDFVCRNRTGEDVCGDSDGGGEEGDNIQLYLIVFVIARVLLSFGVTPVTMIGLIWLDDCVTKETFSFYAGIFCCGWIGGPALGFIIGGYFLSIYTDSRSVDIEIDSSDPRWVGCWWAGFLLVAIVLIFVIIPISGFPKDIPGASEMRSKKKSEAYNSVTNDNAPSMRVDFTAKQIPAFLKYLITNWTYVFIVLFISCDIAIMAGFTVFGPKLVEVQFNLSPGQAGVLFGGLVVPTALIGTLSGGYIVKHLALSITDLMKASIVLSVFVLSGGAAILMNCPDAAFAGVNVPYQSNSLDMNVTQECNTDCWCEDLPFTPVCSEDQVQYYSPCHAGCTYEQDERFYNCSCLLSNTTTVNEGVCEHSACTQLIFFSIIFFVVMIALFINSTMDMSMIIRSVPASHRVLAYLCYNVTQKLIGAVPAPLVFGIALDKTCLLWQDNCDTDGSCFYYDKKKLGWAIFCVCLIYKVLSILFITLAWQLYKPPKEADIITVTVSNGVMLSNGVVNGALDKSEETEEQFSEITHM